MKDGNDEKMMSLVWLHWLHAPSLVSIGQRKLKLMNGNGISFFSNCDLDLDHRHLGSNPKLCLDVSYPYSKFGVNRPKQTKVIERKLNFYCGVICSYKNTTKIKISASHRISNMNYMILFEK